MVLELMAWQFRAEGSSRPQKKYEESEWEQVRGRGDDEHRSFPVKRPGAGTRSELPPEFWRIMAGRESGLWAATRPQALIGYRH